MYCVSQLVRTRWLFVRIIAAPKSDPVNADSKTPCVPRRVDATRYVPSVPKVERTGKHGFVEAGKAMPSQTL